MKTKVNIFKWTITETYVGWTYVRDIEFKDVFNVLFLAFIGLSALITFVASVIILAKSLN